MSACWKAGKLKAFLEGLDHGQIAQLAHDWPLWARDDQLPPERGRGGAPAGGWTTWLILGGRGAGKTRAGAEWLRGQMCGQTPLGGGAVARAALVAETLADARDVMIEGVSGLMAIHPGDQRPRFEPSKRRVVWPNGAIAQMFSAEDPESLRGPQFGAAWSDELCKWRLPDKSWDMLQFGLRLGQTPRQVVTTTPRPIPLLKRLMADGATAVSRAGTMANRANLAPGFIESINARYGGTRLGRQEIDAEILDDNPHALWKRDAIDRHRVAAPPPLRRIVVAVDPPASSGAAADACGIVTAGIGEDRQLYVLADATISGARPALWAERAVGEFHRFAADMLVAEVNQGGEMVRSVIAQIDPDIAFRAVRASRGKWIRAEPVAALYEQGRVHHAGQLSALEDQMCEFTGERTGPGGSPDRVDALVWAVTDLAFGRTGDGPRIRGL